MVPDQLRPPRKSKRAAVTNGHSAREQTDTRSAAPGGPTRRLQLPGPQPALHSTREQPRAPQFQELYYPSRGEERAGGGLQGIISLDLAGAHPKWKVVGSEIQSRPSGAAEKVSGARARGQRRAGQTGGTKGSCGPGRMLCSPAPHPAGSRALPCAQVARPWELQEGVFEGG